MNARFLLVLYEFIIHDIQCKFFTDVYQASDIHLVDVYQADCCALAAQQLSARPKANKEAASQSKVEMALSKLLDFQCFENITDDNVQEKHNKVMKRNTVKGEKTAQKQLREYLAFVGESDTKFWEYTCEQLDSHLTKFWFAARLEKSDPATGKPKKYKIQSLKTLCYPLKRFLIENNFKHDIIVSQHFQRSQIAFQDACKELKQEGYGLVTHTLDIKHHGN